MINALYTNYEDQDFDGTVYVEIGDIISYHMPIRAGCDSREHKISSLLMYEGK